MYVPFTYTTLPKSVRAQNLSFLQQKKLNLDTALGYITRRIFLLLEKLFLKIQFDEFFYKL